MKKIKMVILGVLVVLSGLFVLNDVVAEEEVLPTMTLSPMYQQVILEPGEEYRGVITVSNMASAVKDLKYTLKVGSFSQRANEESEDDYAVVDVDAVTTYNQMMDWITLDREGGSVAPNEMDVVNFVIKVPKDAPAGGQYATILFQNVSDEDLDGTDNVNEGSGVMIKSTVQMASVIYASVAGETREEGVILENKIPAFLLDGALTATSMIENRGNVHTEAEVLLEVQSILGGENLCMTKTEDEVRDKSDDDNESSGGVVTTLVLPDTKRFHQEFCQLPRAGIYKVKQTVRIFGEESVIEGTLIYLPIWVIIMVVFGVILMIIWFVMMASNRKKQRQMTQ